MLSNQPRGAYRPLREEMYLNIGREAGGIGSGNDARIRLEPILDVGVTEKTGKRQLPRYFVRSSCNILVPAVVWTLLTTCNGTEVVRVSIHAGVSEISVTDPRTHFCVD